MVCLSVWSCPLNKIRAILADDEANLLHYLEGMLHRLWPELEIIATATNGLEALSLIRDEEPDIAFLDIRMPVLTGVQVAQRVQGECHVVFITAYDEYAVQAFESAAIDYLLKPIEESRLQQTIQRLKQLTFSHPTSINDLAGVIEKLVRDPAQASQQYLGWIRAGESEQTRLVPVDEVIYFKADDKYTSVVTRDKEYLIRKPICELSTELDPELFWQIHRGIIVQVKQIDRIKRALNGSCKLYLKGFKEALNVSRRYAHLFKQM